jgi:UDP-N-acetylmuramoylalanine--D-glutamate ligase
LHNLLNVMAACAIAAAAGLSPEAMQAGVRGFTGVPHRLEFVRNWSGADWYNDSIATAPERAMAAIRAFEEPLVLLAGGRDKDLPWNDFAALVLRRVDHLIVFGEAAGIILQALERVSGRPVTLMAAEAAANAAPGALTVTHCANLRQAVQAAAQLVGSGDVVLLSPGGTSFDEYRDFEERGACFAQWVRELP